MGSTTHHHCSIVLVALIALAATLSACGEGTVTARGEVALAPITIDESDLAIIRRGEVRRGPTVSGRLTPEQQALVRAEVGGPVSSVHAEPGEQVRRGALLARLDDAALRDQLLSARSAVSAAETTLAVAERELTRDRRLYEAGAIAEQQLEVSRRNLKTTQAQLADAHARLALARQQLQDTTVESPIDGVVSERPVHSGDVVQPGAHLFTIVNPRSMRLNASVPAGDLTEVRVGAPVTFEITGYPDRTFEGHVTRINPTADPATGQVRLFVGIPNDGQELVAGLFAQGRVAVESESGLIVPADALQQEEGASTIAVVHDGVVHHRPVIAGLRDPLSEEVVVKGDVAAGDVVLLGAAKAITEGTRVRIPQRTTRRQPFSSPTSRFDGR